mgnify:CR=1 FL=1
MHADGTLDLTAAAALIAEGIGPGDRVGLLSENRLEWLIADIAIMSIGAIAVPAYTTNTSVNHLHIMNDSGARHAIVSTPQLARHVIAAAAEADLVLGSRYVPGGELRNWPRRRLLLSTFANWYVRAITRLPVRDCTSGFRCWRRDLLARIPLASIASDGYAFQVEMAWEARRAGGRR